MKTHLHLEFGSPATTPDVRKTARTKIVATVGPACCDKEQLGQLINAGVDVFRLNMAHSGPEQQQQHVDNIRALTLRAWCHASHAATSPAQSAGIRYSRVWASGKPCERNSCTLLNEH